MMYGEITKRILPKNDKEKIEAIKEMVSELLEKVIPVFDKTTFIVHEIDGYLTVGMKWTEQ